MGSAWGVGCIITSPLRSVCLCGAFWAYDRMCVHARVYVCVHVGVYVCVHCGRFCVCLCGKPKRVYCWFLPTMLYYYYYNYHTINFVLVHFEQIFWLFCVCSTRTSAPAFATPYVKFFKWMHANVHWVLSLKIVWRVPLFPCKIETVDCSGVRVDTIVCIQVLVAVIYFCSLFGNAGIAQSCLAKQVSKQFSKQVTYAAKVVELVFDERGKKKRGRELHQSLSVQIHFNCWSDCSCTVLTCLVWWVCYGLFFIERFCSPSIME